MTPRAQVMAETDLRKEVGMEEGQDWIEALNSLARKVRRRPRLQRRSSPAHRACSLSCPWASTKASRQSQWRQQRRASLVPLVRASSWPRSHSNLEDEVRLVLNVIIEHKDLGIWKRTLKIKTNLHEQTVTKCLKELEGRKLIKGVKSVKVRSSLVVVTPLVE